MLFIPPLLKFQEFLWFRGILIHIFYHEPCWTSENVLNHFPRAALAYIWKFLAHPIRMDFIEILELQQRIPPFSFDPRPDRFNWIEIRWARRQESWSGSTVCQKLLNLFTPVSPVIIHYYYFIKKLMISFILLIKIFDCFNIGWVSDWMRQHIAVYTDSTNDSHIIFLIFCSLNNQWQHWVPRLPDLTSCSPTICWSFIHVDNLLTFHHIFENLFNIWDSQFNHLFLTSSAVKATVNLQITYVEFSITIS